ncbi:nephrin isoform X1 [Poecilia latipinna]|uniref:nephrin isoform X1 n=2 Tax=Poecilia latipinna TaxID=48699 RepID=UPI00072DCAE6|nr:PREDICTED: nephrin isoform X1 [Poecilia latipinna]
MEFVSAWILSAWTLPFLCFFWGTHAQQAFRTEPRNLTVRMGATAVLKCEVLRASGIVQWAKDGFLLGPQRSLPGFPRYSMIGRRGQYYLRIEDAQLDDDAFFECQAGQSERSDAIVSSPAFLTVQIPPSKPYFTTDVTTPWVAGKKYMVECVAPDAKPSADITLYKDGVDLTGATSFTTSGSKDKLLNTHAEVTVTALRSDNGRELTCHANNEAVSQPVVTTVTMNVYYPPEPPYIIGLDRDVVKAGSLLVLECVSHGGNPLGTLQWTKEGEVLSTTWGEEVVGQKSRSILRLQITPADNQAELSCESANIVSLSPLSVTRKITVFFGPATLTRSGSLEAIEGQELTLSCHASSSNPPVHIRWWLGHKELSNTSVTMEEGENGGMTATSNVTHRVSREENGLKLTCEAFNNGTHLSKIQAAKLTVYYPPQKVFIDSPPEDVPLRSGSRAVLVCHSAGGNPPAKLTWFKNGKKVSDAEPQTSSNMVVTQVLNLLLTASDNQAAYRCDATNEAKRTISAHAKLLVQFTAVTMKITAKEEVFYRGQQMELECLSGSSNPKSDISWKVGPLRLQGVEEAPKEAEFGGVSVLSRLHLNLTSQHHNQKVICQAYSPVLEEGASTFYQLNVIYPPEFSSEQATEVQVVEDDVATIPLMVSANPEVVSCIWLRRKQMLVKGEDIRHHWSDDHSLEIRNVTRKDKGLYTIKCENGEGVNETTVKLDVYYAPTVKAEKDPVYVNQGGTADLICVADANPIIPEMFSWKWLGEEEVEMGEETNENKSSLLTIHNVTRAHAGFYQCSASNGIALPGSVEMRLVVQFTPELRKGPQWRKVASRGDGTATAELVCQAEGIPPVEFTWEKKGMLIDLANPRYEERTARDGSFHTSTLRVVNVSATLDYAVFSCTARNSLGEDKLDIQLVSTNHPDPPSSFSLVGVTHNSVTLEWIPGFNGGLQQRYRIRYIWDQSVSYMYVDVVPPDTTTFTVTGLQPQTTYNFSVNALNSIGESGYADDGAVLTITTEVKKDIEEDRSDDDTQAPSGLPTHLTVAFTVVFGVLLVLNSLGCFFGRKWKNRRDKTKAERDSVVNGQKSEEDVSSQSTGISNKYESREKINTGAQRTLLVDTGSETESNVYESYTAFQEDSHYYYPTGDYKPYHGPHPEDRHGLGAAPVNFESHLYEDVGDRRVYQDTLPSSLPAYRPLFSDRRLIQQAEDWRSPTDPQGIKREGQFPDNQQPERDYDLPFELRGELV